MYNEFMAFYRELVNIEKSIVYSSIDTTLADQLKAELEAILQKFADNKITEIFPHISNLHKALNSEKKAIFLSHLKLLASSHEGKAFINEVLLPFANCDIKEPKNVFEHSKKFRSLVNEIKQEYRKINRTSIDDKSIKSEMIIVFLQERANPQENEIEARKSSGGVPNFAQISGTPGSKDGHWFSQYVPEEAGVVPVELFSSDNLDQVCQYSASIRRNLDAFRDEQIRRIENGQLANKKFHIYQASITTAEEPIPDTDIVERINATFAYYLGHLIKTTGIKTEEEARSLLRNIYINHPIIKHDPSPNGQLRIIAANAMNRAIDSYVNLFKKLTPTPKAVEVPAPNFSR